MKKLFLLLAVAFVALSTSAQLYQKPEKVGKFEIEPFYGLGFGYNYHGQCSDLAATTGVELRGNISNSPWAIGGFMFPKMPFCLIKGRIIISLVLER